MIEDEIRSSKSVDENLLSFSKKIQAIGRKGSVVNHGLNPLSSNLSNLNSSSNITSPLATSSTVIDSEEVENFNDELVLSESVLPVGLTTSSNSSIISTVPNTTPPTLSFAANGSVKFPYPGTNIYIRGLPINTTDESLYNLCIRWGKIISSKAIVDMRTNECKGFGFVMYETEDEAHTALSELNNLGYHVSFAKSLTHASQESYSSKLKNLEDLTSMNIYISNLPLDYDNDKLLELFSDFKVLSHRILKNADGTSRGVGFARFGSREIAQHVIDLFNNVTLKGAKYPLQVRFADSIAQKKLKNQVATSRKRKDSIREQHSPSFNNNYKKLDDFDATSTTKSESEFEFDRTQNSQTF
ncbi:RNA-binding domain-containing protein [Anaeromyces robustus]|uniref:RNA-binding domain-containing protein n=1 Tax=Anaeromyces robustus TaxID=1754192 RepID=A0A1Y1XNS8_9FUNG|nr:RNA-binding domain-containing protein [Anaeromyces robustus]|eukprot:ORX87381.1 RNA-binding domain-containing protein [Anaeromyces robustus]